MDWIDGVGCDAEHAAKNVQEHHQYVVNKHGRDYPSHVDDTSERDSSRDRPGRTT